MKNKVFRLVTVNDGQSDNADIVNVFSRMATGQLNCDLKLLNYCGEVPVSYGFDITAVDMDHVELAVHEHQAMIIKHDRYTLIKSGHFHDELGVHCHATHVNVPKKSVVLHNFSYAQIRPEQREAVRVRVHETLPVRFSFENVNIVGNMVDISGSCISINSSLFPAVKPDQPGLLHFALNGTPLAVFASFVKSTVNGAGGHICVFQIKPDKMNDRVIDSFICLRQVEIIQQLKFFFT